MVTGHYATALLPYELTRKTQRTGFWLFLLAAQFLDFLMLTFVSVGIEKFAPSDFLDVSFSSMRTNMLVSHDVLPVMGWALLFGICVWVITKKHIIALWCVGLIIFHEMCDLVVGFEHNFLGETTPLIGFALYTNAPVIGILIEALMCTAFVFWFCRKRAKQNEPVSPVLMWGLYGLLTGGALATLPMATQSLNSLFGYF